MKKFLLACAAIASLTGAASAATFSPFVTADPFRTPGAPGLQTRAVILSPGGSQNFDGATYTFDLTNIGDSASMDIYGLVQYDSPLQADDLIAQDSTATFDFGGLIGAITIFGQTAGVLPGSALATFTSDIIRIAPALGIKITLADTVFGSVNGVLTNGRPGVGFVNATFTLAAIPVPAALPLSLTALGLMAFVARRRKSTKTVA